ncbi:MAG TPA: hypothetical protein VGM03_18920 [Phycisphaerae bacterium]
MNPIALRLVISGLISALGLGCAAWYLLSAVRRAGAESAVAHRRPWRALGAALCGLLAVAFFIGVNYLDARQAPRAYLILWILILLGVLWLCGLALYDILYTRRHYRRAVRSSWDRGDPSC